MHASALVNVKMFASRMSHVALGGSEEAFMEADTSVKAAVSQARAWP